MLFLLLTNILTQTPIEFEHFLINLDSGLKLRDADAFLQVRQPLHIVLVRHKRIAVYKLWYIVLLCHTIYSFIGSSNNYP